MTCIQFICSSEGDSCRLVHRCLENKVCNNDYKGQYVWQPTFKLHTHSLLHGLLVVCSGKLPRAMKVDSKMFSLRSDDHVSWNRVCGEFYYYIKAKVSYLELCNLGPLSIIVDAYVKLYPLVQLKH